MHNESTQAQPPLSEQILDAYRVFNRGGGELVALRLKLAIKHVCAVVAREETGWLQVYGQCAEAANVEPHSVDLLAAQEAVELVVAGYPLEEGER